VPTILFILFPHQWQTSKWERKGGRKKKKGKETDLLPFISLRSLMLEALHGGKGGEKEGEEGREKKKLI